MIVEPGVLEVNLGRLERHKKLATLIQILIVFCLLPTNVCISIAKFLLRIK